MSCTAPNQMIQRSTGRSPSDLLIQWKPHLEEGRAVERREGRAREACCGKWKRSPNDFGKQKQFYSPPDAKHFFKTFGLCLWRFCGLKSLHSPCKALHCSTGKNDHCCLLQPGCQELCEFLYRTLDLYSCTFGDP